MKNPLLKKIINIADSNPIALMFLADALDKSTARILKDEEVTKKAFEKTFISGEAWISAAKEFENILDAQKASA